MLGKPHNSPASLVPLPLADDNDLFQSQANKNLTTLCADAARTLLALIFTALGFRVGDDFEQ